MCHKPSTKRLCSYLHGFYFPSTKDRGADSSHSEREVPVDGYPES